MKRYTWVLAALLGLLLTLAGCSSAGEKDYIWQQFDSEVRVTADGGPFTFAFRDLPYRRLDTISNITKSLNRLLESTAPGYSSGRRSI